MKNKKKITLKKKDKGNVCKACLGTGESSKGMSCSPCHGTGEKTQEPSIETHRRRLTCDDCGKPREPMYIGKHGLLCIGCMQLRRIVVDEAPKTNSDKRKEKLGENIGTDSLAKYIELPKKQKIAFISECKNLKLLREIVEYEKEHSKKRYKRANKHILLLTK